MAGYRLTRRKATDGAPDVTFIFDGRRLVGRAGDTLAAALIANGISIVGRSFKYHRPRGIFASGPEEPNALMTLRQGGRREPNIPATMIELSEGLVVESQNRWPSLSFDVMAVTGLFSRMLVAGFYYKTFMAPSQRAWMIYERFIRRAAGLGTASSEPDPDRYEKLSLHCDVLVIGSGPAGLAAAWAAAQTGANVLLTDASHRLGGTLNSCTARVDGASAADWCRARLDELSQLPNVTLLPRTTVYGYFDNETLGAVERVADHKLVPDAFEPRQRHLTIHAKRTILATGAIERPFAFSGNDIPGVMLASAAHRFALEHDVAVGRQIVVFTTNDYGYRCACDLAQAGVKVSAIVDLRREPPHALTAEAKKLNIHLRNGMVVAEALGRRSVKGVRLASADRHSDLSDELACDTLLVSGGWSPVVHLASQGGGAPQYDSTISAFVPGAAHRAWISAGAANGSLSLEKCLAEGAEAALKSVATLRIAIPHPAPRYNIEFEEGDPARTAALFEIKGGSAKAFVDLQNDVTAEDVRLAYREGYVSVEHLKRYTTLGMATDQGKTSNVLALGIVAEISGAAISQVGTTRFRPPYTPIALGALAGREIGSHLKPIRRTPLHEWHLANGAEMVNVGLWQRPRAYLRPGEDITAACERESLHVRDAVGIMDVSTLGKIDIQGPDAGAFLDRIYVNMFSTLAVGRARYGVMLREDGLVFDDGTTWRLSETRYLMTTTTANAAAVLQHLEFYLSVVWPDMRVRVTSVTDQWAALAVAGPRSAETLASAFSDVDMASAAFPPMAIRHAKIGNIGVMLCRLSFSGERAYELFCPSGFAVAVWNAVLAAGKPHGIIPYGVEAMSALRIEKGHVASAELDGRVTLGDLNLGKMASTKKDFVGKALMRRPALLDPKRKRLVGITSLTDDPVKGGAHIVRGADPRKPGTSLGHVTSWTWSPALRRHIALALVEGGADATHRSFYAADPVRGTHIPVEIGPAVFYDAEGARQNA